MPARPPRWTALAVALAAASATVGLTAPAHAASSAQRTSADRAGDWLATQVDADGTVGRSAASTLRAAAGLAAAGRQRPAFERAMGWLTTQVDAATTQSGTVRPGLTGLLASTVVAGNRDPRSFGQVDLQGRILSTQATTGGDVGLLQDPSSATVAQHALGLIGLAATRLTTADARVAQARDWLVGQQCSDGGWQAASRNSPVGTTAPCGSARDVEATALAQQALADLGVRATYPVDTWLLSRQDPDGSWASSAETTGLVASALASLGLDVDARLGSTSQSPASWLRSVQRGSGALGHSTSADGDLVLATSQALPGELGAGLPLARRSFYAEPLPPLVKTPLAPLPAVAVTAAPAPACRLVIGVTKRYVIPKGCRPVAKPVRLYECRTVTIKGKRVARPVHCLPVRRT